MIIAIPSGEQITIVSSNLLVVVSCGPTPSFANKLLNHCHQPRRTNYLQMRFPIVFFTSYLCWSSCKSVSPSRERLICRRTSPARGNTRTTPFLSVSLGDLAKNEEQSGTSSSSRSTATSHADHADHERRGQHTDSSTGAPGAAAAPGAPVEESVAVAEEVARAHLRLTFSRLLNWKGVSPIRRVAAARQLKQPLLATTTSPTSSCSEDHVVRDVVVLIEKLTSRNCVNHQEACEDHRQACEEHLQACDYRVLADRENSPSVDTSASTALPSSKEPSPRQHVFLALAAGLTALTRYFIADVLAQQAQHAQQAQSTGTTSTGVDVVPVDCVDLERAFGFALFGGLYTALPYYCLVNFVYPKLYPNHPILAAATDVALVSPMLFFPLFYVTKQLVDGGCETEQHNGAHDGAHNGQWDFAAAVAWGAAHEWQHNFFADNVACATFWMPVTWANYRYVPLRCRMAFVQVVGLLWNLLMSVVRG